MGTCPSKRAREGSSLSGSPMASGSIMTDATNGVSLTRIPLLIMMSYTSIASRMAPPSWRPKRPVSSETLTSCKLAYSAKEYLMYKNNMTTQLFELTVDSRVSPREGPEMSAPTTKEELYTDENFRLESAIGEHRIEDLEWKRPRDICIKPVLFGGGKTRIDVSVDTSGSSFLSIVAYLAEHNKLLRKVVPVSAWNCTAGVFKCRFYVFGRWETIYADDFLPTVKNSIWRYKSASDENEIWVAVLAKCFARLCGSYDAVSTVQLGDAFLALTGGMAERLDFGQKTLDPRNLFQRIGNAVRSRVWVSCRADTRSILNTAFVDGTYSILQTVVVRKNDGTEVGLLKLQNTTACAQWRGPWSKGSPQWEKLEQPLAERNAMEDRGEFWVCLEDFMQYFVHPTVGSFPKLIDTNGLLTRLGFVTYIYGVWPHTSSAAVLDTTDDDEQIKKEPKIVITLPDEVNNKRSVLPLYIQLLQENKRRDDRAGISFKLYKCTESNDNLLLVKHSPTNLAFGIQLSHLFHVQPDKYVIVPSFTKVGRETQYLLRLFTSCPLAEISVE